MTPLPMLKGCPFCGAAAGYRKDRQAILCTSCLAEGPVTTPEGILILWNARADPTKLEETLFDAIAHGDDEHRAWLKEAIDAHFAGRPVPEPRGTGRKAAKLEMLVEALTEARSWLEFYGGDRGSLGMVLERVDAALTGAAQ